MGEDPALRRGPVPAAVHGPGGVPDRERDGDAQQRAQLCQRPDPVPGTQLSSGLETSSWRSDCMEGMTLDGNQFFQKLEPELR